MLMGTGRNNINIILCGLLILIAFSAGLYAARDIWLSNDSMRYAIVSQQIAAGRGLNVSVIQFLGLVPDSHGTVPFVGQPLFFPAMLAVLGTVTPERIWPGQLLNVLCHVVSTIITWLIAKRLVGNFASFIAGLTVALSMSLLNVCHWLWSEPLFITLILTTIYCLGTARLSNHPGRWTLAASLSASAVVATRYTGIAVIGLFVFEIGYLWKQNLTWRTVVRRVSCFILPMLTFALFFVRNKLILGLFRGYHQNPPGRSVYDSVVGVINHTLNELALERVFISLLYRIGLWEYRKLFLLVAVLLLIIWLFMSFRRSKLKDIMQMFRGGYDLIILFIVCYMLLIAYGMYRYQPNFEKRFFAPLIPLVLIFIVSILSPAYAVLTNRFSRVERNIKTALLLILVSCSVIWLTGNTSVFTEKPYWLTRIDTTDTFAWLESNVPTGQTIATNRPFDVSFYGVHSTLKLPSRDWDRGVKIPENINEALPERMVETRAEYLVLFADKDGLREDYFGEFIATLSKRQSAGSFEMIFSCDDGVVYQLDL